MTPPPLLSLPNEILEHIIDLSSVITNRQQSEELEFYGWPYPEYNYINLKSIALCCRHLYTLCAPFLWRDKEFILPHEDDTKPFSMSVHMVATDILQNRTLFQQQHDHSLGDYVRSLSRDLTNGPHYDLDNSKLMAKLVCNLKALRIDFHPKARTEHYGVRYFVESCPHLAEVYLSNCKDTFNDFEALLEAPLISMTLTDCTIKEITLKKMAVKLTKLRTVLLQHVLIEPSTVTKYTNTQLVDTRQLLHPFHYQNNRATAIPQHLFSLLLSKHNCNLTHLALTSDSIDYTLVQDIITWSPHLTKLALILNDLIPLHIYYAIKSISSLSKLVVLSLSFARYDPTSNQCEKLPCHAPASIWSHFATSFPALKLLYINTLRLLVYQDFIPTLIKTSLLLNSIMIHNLALVTIEHQQEGKEDEAGMIEAYTRDLNDITYDIQQWNTGKECLLTYQQAKEKGFHCFDPQDQVVFVKGSFL